MRSCMKTHFGFVLKENAEPNNSIWHDSCQILSPHLFFTVSPKQIIAVCGESRPKQTTERIYKINQLSVTPCEGPCQLRRRLWFRKRFYCLCCVSVNLTMKNVLKAHICTEVFIISDQLSHLDLVVILCGSYIVSSYNTDASMGEGGGSIEELKNIQFCHHLCSLMSFKTCMMYFVFQWNTKGDYTPIL